MCKLLQSPTPSPPPVRPLHTRPLPTTTSLLVIRHSKFPFDPLNAHRAKATWSRRPLQLSVGLVALVVRGGRVCFAPTTQAVDPRLTSPSIQSLELSPAFPSRGALEHEWGGRREEGATRARRPSKGPAIPNHHITRARVRQGTIRAYRVKMMLVLPVSAPAGVAHHYSTAHGDDGRRHMNGSTRETFFCFRSTNIISELNVCCVADSLKIICCKILQIKSFRR